MGIMDMPFTSIKSKAILILVIMVAVPLILDAVAIYMSQMLRARLFPAIHTRGWPA